jgi:hypothetical protein
VIGAYFPAVEERVKLCIHVLGGFWGKALPEAHQLNYLPRIKIPVPKMNGGYDMTLPFDAEVKPLAGWRSISVRSINNPKSTMAKKIEDQSTESLLKRKKLAIWLLWLMLFAVLITLAASVYDYFTEDEFNFTTFLASISACAAAALTLFLGLKKIREELDRRA